MLHTSIELVISFYYDKGEVIKRMHGLIDGECAMWGTDDSHFENIIVYKLLNSVKAMQQDELFCTQKMINGTKSSLRHVHLYISKLRYYMLNYSKRLHDGKRQALFLFGT